MFGSACCELTSSQARAGAAACTQGRGCEAVRYSTVSEPSGQIEARPPPPARAPNVGPWGLRAPCSPSLPGVRLSLPPHAPASGSSGADPPIPFLLPACHSPLPRSVAFKLLTRHSPRSSDRLSACTVRPYAQRGHRVWEARRPPWVPLGPESWHPGLLASWLLGGYITSGTRPRGCRLAFAFACE